MYARWDTRSVKELMQGTPEGVAPHLQTESRRTLLGTIRAVAGGLANREIGEPMFVTESTVKTHVGRILMKLGLRDRVHAVIFAYENGLAGGRPTH
jgi:DNA-binding NarL/FixJ family response regulator